MINKYRRSVYPKSYRIIKDNTNNNIDTKIHWYLLIDDKGNFINKDDDNPGNPVLAN